MAGRSRVIRTTDGIQYDVEVGPGSEPVSVGDRGELVRTDQVTGAAIEAVADSVKDSIRLSGARRATVQFSLTYNASGALFVSRGQGDAHLVVTLEFEVGSDSDATA